MQINPHWNSNGHKIVLTAFLFIGIFMPCLFKISMQYIVLAIELLYIGWNCVKFRTIVLDKQLIKIIIAFAPFYLYYSLIILTKIGAANYGQYIVEYTQSISIGVYVIGLGIAIHFFKRSNCYEEDLLYKMIIAVGIVQLFCVVSAFLFPSVKQFFNNLTLNNSFNETMASWYQKQWYMSWRAYGLAENLFDGFGFIISIIISITLIYGLNNKRKSIVVLGIIMMIMPLLNARTGLLLCLVSLVIITLNYLNPKRVLWFAAAGIVVFILFVAYFDQLPLGLKIALGDGFQDIRNLLKGEKSGVFVQILGADIIFPEDIFFGAGISPERYAGYTGIDSGYIQCLWRFGIFGTALLFFGFAYSFVNIYKSNQKKEKVLVLSIATIMLIYSFKLFLFNSYSDIFLLFVIIFCVGSGTKMNRLRIQ